MKREKKRKKSHPSTAASFSLLFFTCFLLLPLPIVAQSPSKDSGDSKVAFFSFFFLWKREGKEEQEKEVMMIHYGNWSQFVLSSSRKVSGGSCFRFVGTPNSRRGLNVRSSSYCFPNRQFECPQRRPTPITTTFKEERGRKSGLLDQVSSRYALSTERKTVIFTIGDNCRRQRIQSRDFIKILIQDKQSLNWQ